MKLDSYLCLAGNEVLNGARTAAYLDSCLGGIRRVRSGSPCDCDPLAETYVDPVADDAPWVDASRPESAEFFGFLGDVRLSPAGARSVVPRGLPGATIGLLNDGARILSVEANMFAGSVAGMAWGERWLAEVLTGSVCEDDDEAEVSVGCDFRRLYRAGVIEGPIFAPIGTIAEARIQTVSFQLAAGNSYMWSVPTEVASGTLTMEGEAVCAQIDTTDWVDQAARVVLTADQAIGQAFVLATPLAEGQTCPAAGAPPCSAFEIGPLEQGDVYVLDSIDTDIYRIDASDKVKHSAFDRTVAEPCSIQWVHVPPCSSMCVCVIAGADTPEMSVSIEVAERER